METRMEETDRELTRAEAAAYLSEKGRATQVSTLAKYAGDGKGPTFSKDEGRASYKESELDRWLAEGPTTTGRPRKVRGKAKPIATDLPSKVVDLRAALIEHIELADLFASRNGDAYIGFQFARSLDKLRRLVS
jgi:hypothetical protein